VHTYAPDFPRVYYDRTFRKRVLEVTGTCPGCMYGSYPEMTISMRYLAAKWERIKLFLTSPPPKPWPVSYEQMLATAERIRSEMRDRILLPGTQNRLQLLDAGAARGQSA
jgi:hypothetical protein